MINQIPDLLRVRINNESIELYENICIAADNAEQILRRFGSLGSLSDYSPEFVRINIKRWLVDSLIKQFEEDEKKHSSIKYSKVKKDPH